MTSRELIKEGLPVVREYNDKYESASLDEVIRYANENDVSAIYELAYRYRCGDGGAERDEVRAVELYKKVLEFQNNTGALYRIGFAYSDGIMGEALKKECIPYFEAAIELKDADSAIQMGIIYEYDEKIAEQDFDKALHYYNLAIQYGRRDGYYHVGNVFKKRKQYDKAIEIYQYAVDNEEFDSALELGILFENGTGCERDYQKALYYYSLAYENEIEYSGYFLGRLFFLGKGVDVDEERAFKLFKEESEKGVKMANLYLGQYYGMGIDNYLTPDTGVAFLYLDNSEEFQKSEVLYAKGIIYLNTLKDNEKAKKCLKEAVEMGHEKAREVLDSIQRSNNNFKETDDMYSNYNVKQLKDIGSEHWEEACEQGNKFAPILIGLRYESGTDGFPIDLDKAEYYFKIGLERGEAFGALKLGDIYRTEDKEKAIGYYKKSIDMGWLDAAVNLAIVLIDLKKYEEARRCLNKYFDSVEEPSKENMYVYACAVMARSYMHDTVNKDDVKVMVKYLKLGEQYGGNDLIYAQLGEFYSKGIGVEKNLEKAIYYYDKKGDYYNIGKIYMEEYNEPRKALELFEKAYREQNDDKGLEAAYEILAMYCFPEFENIIKPDYAKAEYYCREILDKEILPSVMYYALGVLSKIWNNQNIDDDIIQERNNYLIQKYKCFAYVNKNDAEEACNSLKDYLETICFNYFSLDQFDNVNYYFDEIERFIENSNPNLMPGFRLGQGTKSYAFGLLYLDNNMLAKAKQSFEVAKACGREDADDYLRRFSTSLFGKLTFK